MAMATTTYKMEAMIHGYHVYATVWDAQIGEARREGEARISPLHLRRRPK